MSLGKWCPNVRSPSSKSSAVKSIPLIPVSAEQLRERLSRTGIRVSVQTVLNRLPQRTAPLLNMIGMEEEVLWYHVVLQDDNARPHRARIVQQFLQQNNVDHLDWPARSPDLSPIEHVWDILGQRVREFHDQERSKLWAQPCRRSGGGYPSYRLPDSSGVCVVVVWPA